jgi:putative ABC transport system ATP-binding protein
MELTTGLACREMVFRWPEKGDHGVSILDGVNANFKPGTVTLVTGETGSGKSTLLNLLAGLLRPTSGEVWADGDPVSRWPAMHRNRWRRKVGIVFQHLALVPDLSVAENLLLRLLPLKMPGSRMQRNIVRQLAGVDLSTLFAAPVRELSGGQRQRVAVARALAGRPAFVLADEPTAFQDDGHAALIADRLTTAAKKGAVVVICSHDPRLRKMSAVDLHCHLKASSLTIRPRGCTSRREP